jgi:predicted ester cyclase
MAAAAALVSRFYSELWNEWNLDLIDEILAPEVSFRGSRGSTMTGRAAFREYVEATRAGFHDWHNHVEELLEADDRVAARLRWTGTHTGVFDGVEPTGARVDYVGAAFFRIAADLIESAWVVGDSRAFWSALGVAE